MSFHDFDNDDFSETNVISEINVTPLVDVMLVLLIIFILTMPLLKHAINIDLPKTQVNASTPAKPAIQISVAKDASIYWNDEKISLQQLQQRFGNMTASAQQREIQLRGDQRADYGHIMAVMAAAEKAGIRRLGFVTDVESSQPR